MDKEIKKQIDNCMMCTTCKHRGRVYGKSAPRDASVNPWQEVHCDSIGNWKIDLKVQTVTFHAMTMIDPSTNLVEIKATKLTTAEEGADAVENTWLSC